MQKNYDQEALKRQTMSKGMAIGMVLFMPFGVILWLLLDNSVMLGMGIVLGISIGAAIGEAMYKKEVSGK